MVEYHKFPITAIKKCVARGLPREFMWPGDKWNMWGPYIYVADIASLLAFELSYYMDK